MVVYKHKYQIQIPHAIWTLERHWHYAIAVFLSQLAFIRNLPPPLVIIIYTVVATAHILCSIYNVKLFAKYTYDININIFKVHRKCIHIPLVYLYYDTLTIPLLPFIYITSNSV